MTDTTIDVNLENIFKKIIEDPKNGDLPREEIIKICMDTLFKETNLENLQKVVMAGEANIVNPSNVNPNIHAGNFSFLGKIPNNPHSMLIMLKEENLTLNKREILLLMQDLQQAILIIEEQEKIEDG